MIQRLFQCIMSNEPIPNSDIQYKLPNAFESNICMTIKLQKRTCWACVTGWNNSTRVWSCPSPIRPCACRRRWSYACSSRTSTCITPCVRRRCRTSPLGWWQNRPPRASRTCSAESDPMRCDKHNTLRSMLHSHLCRRFQSEWWTKAYAIFRIDRHLD